MKKKAIELIVESNNKNSFWGRVEYNGSLIIGEGDTFEDMIQNVKDGLEDSINHEWENDPFWKGINLKTFEFDIKYDLQAFFEKFNVIKISNIGNIAGMNESLIRQYATGKKFPSIDQAKKIEHAIHQLGKQLQRVSIYA